MPVATKEYTVTLRHPNGSSAQVLLHGATVISWCAPSPSSSTPIERLYTSSTAFLDGTKPVRGGIPLVFPFFGPPTRPEHAALPQHGFARSSLWELHSTILDDDTGVSVCFDLAPRESYPSLTYVVTLGPYQLTSTLHLANSSTTPLTFQALFHNYIRADAANATVTPLKGITYVDKVQPGHPELREEREKVDARIPTDSVYKSAGGNYQVNTGTGVVAVKAVGLDDVVVWNPGKEGGEKMKDLEDLGWTKFLAVEPGAASYWIELAPNEHWMGQQALTVV